MNPPFDKNALLERVDNDLEFLAETVEMLDEDTPSMLQQIHEAVEAKNAEGLSKSAHALKGMLSNFCAPQAEAAARQLEYMGREGQLDGASDTLANLRRETEHLREALNHFIRDASE